MDNKIEVIGIDHGWSGMKTVHEVFTSGCKEISTEPTFFLCRIVVRIFIRNCLDAWLFFIGYRMSDMSILRDDDAAIFIKLHFDLLIDQISAATVW